MKKHKDTLKLTAIILLPYLLNLIYLTFQYWITYKQSAISYHDASSAFYYDMMYDTYNRFLLIAKLIEGAFLALWFYLIYTTRKKSTAIAVLVNLFVLAALVAYTLIEPSQEVQIINILYYLLVQQRSNYLIYIGMHIFALICLFLSKDQWIEQLPVNASTEEIFSLDDMSDEPHLQTAQDDILVKKETIQQKIRHTPAKPAMDSSYDQDDEVWKP